MGSIGDQSPWTPYNYKDCSQGICSMYCPQWCYIIFPPPPPIRLSNDKFETPFTPLVIVIIGILASALMLVSYYTIVMAYCMRRNNSNSHVESDENHGGTDHDQWHVSSIGLDEALIKSITVFKYKKFDSLIEGTECSVCLCEFEENDSLRLLPNCCHAFHLPCIDTWLKTQANCPLCRANVISTQDPSALNVASPEIQGSGDLIVVVDDYDCESNRGDEVALQETEPTGAAYCPRPKSPHLITINDMSQPMNPRLLNTNEEDTETRNCHVATTTDGKDVKRFTRSYSLGTISCQNELSIARIGEGGEYIKIKKSQSCKEIGSSRGFPREENKPNNYSQVAMK